MTEVLGKREAETALWELYEPFLHFFFIVQNRTLQEVRGIMAKGCGFDRKLHQYELKFKRWGFRKSFSGEEWREAKFLMDKRKLNGKLSNIMSDGRIIKRAQKRAGHHGYETTYERLQRQNNAENMSHSEPTFLVLRTPSPEPCVNNGHIEVSKTLWYSSLHLLDNIFNNTSQNQVGIIKQDPTHILCRAISRMSLQSQPKEASGVMAFILQRHELRDQLFDSPCGFAIDIDETIAMRTGEALMDLLKLAVYLLSNNVARHTGIGPLVISICRLQSNRDALEHLLKQQHPTIQAFAEGLLHYASSANDVDLVKVLLRHGVDPTSNCGTCWAIKSIFDSIYSGRSRLLCAISSGSSDAAVALLEAGANEKSLDFDGSSCLMTCYKSKLIPLALELLQQGADITVSSSDRNVRHPPTDAISTAVLYGGLPAVKTLAEHDPLVFRNMIHNDTSKAFVMAASLGNEAVVQFFLSYDISLSDCGTGLCGAAANGKIQMVKLLLSHGVNVNGNHGWIWHLERRYWFWRYCNISSLEAAVRSGQMVVAKLLLEHGANTGIKPSILNKLCLSVIVSICGFSFPEKLDSSIEYFELVEPSELTELAESGKLAKLVELVELLLQAGAKPDEATLVWLSFVGAADLVRGLIERGARPTSLAAAWGSRVFRKPRLLSALAAALYAGNDELASFLLQRGANVNIPAGIDGHMSPLAASICCGRLNWTKELIHCGADLRDPIALWAAAHTDSIDAYDLICSAFTETRGRSTAEFARLAASEAIIRGNMPFLRTIVDNGIHLNAPAWPWKAIFFVWDAPSPNDPLLCAVRSAKIDAIQLLLDNGADPNRAHLDDHIKEPILSNLPNGIPSSVLCSIASALINAGARINYSEITRDGPPVVNAIESLRSMMLLGLAHPQRGAC